MTSIRLRFISYYALFAIALGVISCQNRGKTEMVIDYLDFSHANTPPSTTVSFEGSSPFVIGKTEVISTGYMMYLYDSDDMLGITNQSFELVCMAGHKGSGPGEINGVSGRFGQPIDSIGILVSVFDPYLSSMFALDTETGIMQKIMQFPDSMSRYHPFDVMRLKNGVYISPRGDFQYGIVSFNPKSNEVKEWPVGLKNIDITHPLENHVNLRAYDYNEKGGIIAEIYGTIPKIIIHDESGEIIRVFTITGMPRETDESKDYFRDICLTDEFIFLLWGDPSFDPTSHVLVMTHSGQPIVSLKIRPTHNITIDISNSCIISTNPEIDDANIVVYGPIEQLVPNHQYIFDR